MPARRGAPAARRLPRGEGRYRAPLRPPPTLSGATSPRAAARPGSRRWRDARSPTSTAGARRCRSTLAPPAPSRSAPAPRDRPEAGGRAAGRRVSGRVSAARARPPHPTGPARGATRPEIRWFVCPVWIRRRSPGQRAPRRQCRCGTGGGGAGRSPRTRVRARRGSHHVRSHAWARATRSASLSGGSRPHHDFGNSPGSGHDEHPRAPTRPHPPTPEPPVEPATTPPTVLLPTRSGSDRRCGSVIHGARSHEGGGVPSETRVEALHAEQGRFNVSGGATGPRVCRPARGAGVDARVRGSGRRSPPLVR